MQSFACICVREGNYLTIYRIHGKYKTYHPSRPTFQNPTVHHCICKLCVKSVIGLAPKVGEKQSKKSFLWKTFLKEICLHVGNVLMFAQFLWRRMHNKDFFWPLHNKV